MILTRNEVAEGYGISYQGVLKWIKEGKILEDSNKMIDTNHHLFKTFDAQRKAMGKGFKQKVEIAAPDKINESTSTPVELDELSKLEILRKKEELENKRLQNRKLQLQNDKIEGTLIPVDAVEFFFTDAINTINSQYKQSVDGVAQIIKERTGANQKQFVEMKKDIDNSLKEIIKRTKKALEESVPRIVEEYSEVRGRGERK